MATEAENIPVWRLVCAMAQPRLNTTGFMGTMGARDRRDEQHAHIMGGDQRSNFPFEHSSVLSKVEIPHCSLPSLLSSQRLAAARTVSTVAAS